MVHNAVFLFFPSKFNVHSCPLLDLLLNVNEVFRVMVDLCLIKTNQRLIARYLVVGIEVGTPILKT